MSDFRETLYTIDTKGDRKWVYPVQVGGTFRRYRKQVATLLLLCYVLLPWIKIGGDQAVHLDIFHRRFVFFGATFWATDTTFLWFTLSTLAFTLFFFTAVFGRIWCGWACPQTVFIEFLYRPIENWIEGDAHARRTLDNAPWTLRKIRIKGTKYLIYGIISWFLASTFLAYYIGHEDLIRMMGSYPSANLSTFILTLASTGLVLFQFGWFREQFCTVVCPYARFQSVLLDDRSLLVGYDPKRGEPRGKKSEENKGDCIDCGLCVRVCPTGIDIRNGLQLECIQCASCVDACDSIMEKINRPPGLIRYDTERGLKGLPVRWLRPRVVLYATILTFLLSLFSYSLENRNLSDVQIFHSSRDSLFKTVGEEIISNHFELHISNKDHKNKSYLVTLPKDALFTLIMPINPFPVAGEGNQVVPLFLEFPKSILEKGKRGAALEVTDGEDLHTTLYFTLIGPG